MGDAEGALEAMTEACRMYPSPGAASLFNPAPSERARLLLVQGRIAEAERWMEERGLTEQDALSYPHERDYLMLARVLLARSQGARALGLLDGLDGLAKSQDRKESLIQIRTLRSLALQATGDHRGALTALVEALSLAHPQGYTRVFVDEGPPMAALIQSLVRAWPRGRGAAVSPAEREHLNRVVRAFRPPAPRDAWGRPGGDGAIEPLTRGELEVLGLMAAGRRNRQIADELVVTLETVKRHVSHIFDKLGAVNRTEAVARARELQLVP